jgi:ketosteroid isomerase-like protein
MEVAATNASSDACAARHDASLTKLTSKQTFVIGRKVPGYSVSLTARREEMKKGAVMQRIAVIVAVAVSLGAWSARAASTNIKSVEAAAHRAYVAAINSNDTETLMADLTDDMVYQAPNEPEIVGKEAVRKWVAGYFDAYRTTWEKNSIGFTVIGDWAFERYEYKSSDIDKKTGAVTTDKGKGVNIFRRGTDGKWRVAIDGWSSDIPIAK